MARCILIGLVAIALIVAGLGVTVRLYMSRNAEIALRPEERTDIRALHNPLPGNVFLACPASYCDATASWVPVFDIPVEQLMDVWDRFVATEPQAFQVEADRQSKRFTLIQRTPLLRFPDIVTVQFVALGGRHSTLALYSRSRYGKGDFGTNRKRVLRWLSRIEALAGG